MIQVRNFPDWLRDELVHRAKRSQRTLAAYVRHILECEVARPPAEEVLERLRFASRSASAATLRT